MKLVSSQTQVLGFVKTAQLHSAILDWIPPNITGFILFLIGFSKNFLGKKEKEPGKKLRFLTGRLLSSSSLNWCSDRKN